MRGPRSPPSHEEERSSALLIPQGAHSPQTEACMAQLRVGDLVIRSHRLLKTRGAIVRVAAQRRGEAPHVWVKWNHSDTLPNPSLEAADNLKSVERPDEPPTASPCGTGSVEGDGVETDRVSARFAVPRS